MFSADVLVRQSFACLSANILSAGVGQDLGPHPDTLGNCSSEACKSSGQLLPDSHCAAVPPTPELNPKPFLRLQARANQECVLIGGCKASPGCASWRDRVQQFHGPTQLNAVMCICTTQAYSGI